jgi:hypothetical protein
LVVFFPARAAVPPPFRPSAAAPLPAIVRRRADGCPPRTPPPSPPFSTCARLSFAATPELPLGKTLAKGRRHRTTAYPAYLPRRRPSPHELEPLPQRLLPPCTSSAVPRRRLNSSCSSSLAALSCLNLLAHTCGSMTSATRTSATTSRSCSTSTYMALFI